MREEVKIFFTALMFYTRIPTPKKIGGSPDHLAKSIRYLPLIGWIVGGVSALVIIGSNYVFMPYITVVLGMVASVFITGAFHEDGLADVCDGFGGGWTKEKILLIMKDSRVGTFGVVGLIMALLLKLGILIELIDFLQHASIDMKWYLALILISGHSLSRLMAILAMVNNNYSRDNDSKSKAAASGEFKWFSKNVLIAIIFGVAPLIFFFSWEIYLAVTPMLMVMWLMRRYFYKKINGYTGDCLGAIQQVSEIVFYLSLMVIWKFI